MTGRQFRILVVLTVASGFLGGAASNLLLRGAPAMPQATVAKVQDKVVAKAFELVDEAGKTRATLGRLPNGSSGLLLYDAAGEMRADLSLFFDGSPGLWLYDAAGEGRAALHLVTDGSPALDICDATRRVRATVGCTLPKSTRSGAEPKNPESTLTLFNPDGDVIWQAP